MLQLLKRIRVSIAIFFFITTSLLFLDLNNSLPVEVNTFLVSLQLIPSLIRTIIFFSVASAGLFFILLITLLFGRVYCSTICPLGTLQDVVIWIAKRINNRRWFQYKKPDYIIHYLLSVFMSIFAFAGSVFILNLFEPFSNYGRILSNLVSPVVESVNNILAYILEKFGNYSIYHIPFLHSNIISILLSVGFLCLIVYLSYYYGRLFCNLLCPAGALLGILSRFSIFKIVIDENDCKDCGLCEKVCKARCVKSDSREIDFAACVGCLNCIDVCPTMVMNYRIKRRRRSQQSINVNEDRRAFLQSTFIPVIGTILPEIIGGDTTESIQSGYDESRKHPISPPGSVSVTRFSNLCTACHLCINSCPTQVLYPSFLDYGLAGILQPRMNYAASYCNYDCVICSQVCPTGAILPLDTVAKKEIQIGKAHFIKNDCIVVTKKTDCAACSEHCPTKAVQMVPFDHLFLPEVNNEICIGCGACEHACPSKPRKAIYVDANPIHQKVKKPEIQKMEKIIDGIQEFPF